METPNITKCTTNRKNFLKTYKILKHAVDKGHTADIIVSRGVELLEIVIWC